MLKSVDQNNNLNLKNEKAFIDIDIDSENDNDNTEDTDLDKKICNKKKFILKKSPSLPSSTTTSKTLKLELNEVNRKNKPFQFNLLSNKKGDGKQREQEILSANNNEDQTTPTNDLFNKFNQEKEQDDEEEEEEEDDIDIDDDVDLNLDKINDLNDNIFDKTLDTTSNFNLNNVTSTPISQLNQIKDLSFRRQQQQQSQDLSCPSSSMIDGLLTQIYDRYSCSKDVHSLNSTSSYLISDSDLTQNELLQQAASLIDQDYERKILLSNLKQKNKNDLNELINEMNFKVNQMSSKLIRYLRLKDKLSGKINKNCDLITAFLQATSLKRRVDTQMKFSINPLPGELGFKQWKEAIRAVSRLNEGIPIQFRKNIWINLANQFIKEKNIDWEKTCRFVFNDRSNPDDDELGIQIVKDLHRTGCSAFSGNDNDYDRSLLKRVLLAYARYNKQIGYCQGFNIIAAFILEIVDKKEDDALLVMIFLIDSILPNGYYTNSMHTLAIDMVVFREMLRQKLPKLYQHLNVLQNGTINEQQAFSLNNNNYEPPLTNVFTMQWFLTLFATCLPKASVLRIWDFLFLDGIEILFRTALAIWEKLSLNVMKATSADQFYTLMSSLTVKLLDDDLINEQELIEKIYSYGSVPLAGLRELREKFTFNIKPFQLNLQPKSQQKTADSNKNKTNSSTYSTSGHNGNKSKINENLNSNNNNVNDEDMDRMISCFALMMPHLKHTRPELLFNHNVATQSTSSTSCGSSLDISSITPGAFSFIPQLHNPKPIDEHLTLDINELKKQYMKLKQRQQQAQIIIQTAGEAHRLKMKSTDDKSLSGDELSEDENNKLNTTVVSLVEPQKQQQQQYKNNAATHSTSSPYLLENSPIYNHLLLKSQNKKKNTLKQPISLTCSPMTPNIPQINDTRRYAPSTSSKIGNDDLSDDNVDDDDDDDDNTTVFDSSDNEKPTKLNELTLVELAKIDEIQVKKKENVKIKPKSSQNIKNTSANKTTTSTTTSIKQQQQQQPVRLLNHPFPAKPINSLVAKNGLRLGLYK